MASTTHLEYSVVIPIKDEAENLEALLAEIEPVMKSMGKKWELIFVDDGSTDGSLQILKKLSKEKSFVRTLIFPRNFGQSSAFKAGFDAAQGRFIITLDGDLQNDPRDIPKLIAIIENCDLVVGWRKTRKDPWKKKVISKISNFIRSRLCQDGVHDTGCSLKIYRKEALQKIKMYRGMHRFLPALFLIEGFKVKEVEVNHRERARGKTKYHFFNRLIGPILDMFAVWWMRKRHLKHTFEEMVE